jgi:multiple antibiotic resistance protein
MHFTMGNVFAAATTLFVVIDVIGGVPTIISVKQKAGKLDALPITLFSGFLMLLFLFLGQKILEVLGVEIKSFALAGSLVLFVIALEMLSERSFFKPSDDGETTTIVPVAFPILSGVGTLTTILSLNHQYNKIEVIGGILINLVIIYATLMAADWIEKKMGTKTLTVIKKFFGVILLAIAIQMFKANW